MKKLSAVIHGDSGVGKSWLGDTAPGPRLILDIEGETEWTPSEKIQWDGRTEPPACDPDQSVVVKVTDFEQVAFVYQWLASGKHPFRSLVFDSLHELQKRAKDSVANGGVVDQQGWGEVLNKMERMVRAFRDMLNAPGQPLEVIIYLAGSHERDGKRRPMLQGAFGDTYPYYVSLIGYLWIETSDKGVCRRLLIQPLGPFEAKDRTHLLSQHYGQKIENPDIAEMVGVLNGAA